MRKRMISRTTEGDLKMGLVFDSDNNKLFFASFTDDGECIPASSHNQTGAPCPYLCAHKSEAGCCEHSACINPAYRPDASVNVASLSPSPLICKTQFDRIKELPLEEFVDWVLHDAPEIAREWTSSKYGLMEYLKQSCDR